jgi:anaerobic magnesium-protoporphyrin IX monomethyl ester cyclase
MKLNILLVKPFQETNEVQPPLGLGYLASTVKDKHNVKILDGIKDNLTLAQLKEILKVKYDIIGIQCYTVDLNIVREYIELIKKKLPKAIIIIGGPQPSMDPKGTMDFLKKADIGFVDESEFSFPMLLTLLEEKGLKLKNISANELRKIPAIIFRKKSKLEITAFKRTDNLDGFDPSYELFDLKSYPIAPHGGFCRQYPTAPIIITRGCPFGCKFCGSSMISGHKIRSHSVDYVINQIIKLKQEYGIKEIHIEDDNFTMNRRFVEEFCKKLIKLDLGITWTCPNGIRIDTLDEKLLRLMMQSGMYSISVGIESGSDRIRKAMGKKLTTQQIYDKMKIIDRVGITAIGFFIIGYPGETEKEINETIEFACKLNLKRANFSAFKPFPGTPIYTELVRHGKLKKLDWDTFSLHKISWAPDGMTEKQLDNLRKKALWKFYFRPRIILSMMREIKSLKNLLFIVKRIYRLLFKYTNNT